MGKTAAERAREHRKRVADRLDGQLPLAASAAVPVSASSSPSTYMAHLEREVAWLRAELTHAREVFAMALQAVTNAVTNGGERPRDERRDERDERGRTAPTNDAGLTHRSGPPRAPAPAPASECIYYESLSFYQDQAGQAQTVETQNGASEAVTSRDERRDERDERPVTETVTNAVTNGTVTDPSPRSVQPTFAASGSRLKGSEEETDEMLVAERERQLKDLERWAAESGEESGR